VSGLDRDTVTGLTLASWGRRVGATVFDGLVLLIPEIVIYLGVGNASLFYTLLSIALQGGYLVWFLSRPLGQTIGNRIVKTRVVQATSGASLEFATSWKRWFIMALLNVSLYLGVGLVLLPLDYLWPLWDKRRQTLHDKFAGTIVVMI